MPRGGHCRAGIFFYVMLAFASIAIPVPEWGIDAAVLAEAILIAVAACGNWIRRGPSRWRPCISF